jgi:hypothetical protein
MFQSKPLCSLGIIAVGGALLAGAGCKGRPQETYLVSGVLEWQDGEPAIELAGATVEFQVVDGVQIRVSPRGEIQSDGRFTIGTYQPKDGAPAGNYLAMVMPLLMADPGSATIASPLDRRYQSFTTTPLKVTVEPQPKNELILTVEMDPNFRAPR